MPSPAIPTTIFNKWSPQGRVLTNNGTGNAFANPLVRYDPNPVILSANPDGKIFKMWCCVNTSSTGGIYYFESADGITWTPFASNPIIAGATQWFPKIFFNAGTYYLYVGQGPIVVYTSTDGVTFTSRGTAIPLGASGSWDNHQVFQLAVLGIIGGVWYGYYGATGTPGPLPTDFNAGLATSSDGITWVKNPANPIIKFASGQFWFETVNGTYYGWSGAPYVNSELAPLSLFTIFRWSATNPAGPWTRLTSNSTPVPTYYPAIPADYPPSGSNLVYNIGDPTIVEALGNCYLYFSAGNNGVPMGVNAAVSAGTSLAQLVGTYEGVVGAPISAAPELNLVTLASDPGTGANANPISGNWTPISLTGVFTSAQRFANLIIPSVAAKIADSFWNALTWGSDQWSQVVISQDRNGSGAGLSLRDNISGVQTQYRFQWSSGASSGLGSPGNLIISKTITGTLTNLFTTSNFVVNVGDKLLAVVNGNMLLFYWNGHIIGSFLDTSISSGAAGFEIFAGTTPTNAALSAWSGGSFQAAPPAPSIGSGKSYVQWFRKFIE